jgi:hypothetical protein
MIGEVIKEKDGKYKVYFFYKKDTDTGKAELYAYTRTKSMYKRFKKERNMDCFTIRKEYVDKYVWDELDRSYGDSMIVIEPFESGDDCINLAVTIRENNMVNDICENMLDDVEEIAYYFDNYVSLKKEYQDVIDVIYNNMMMYEYTTVDNYHAVKSNFDTLKMLIEIASDTFFTKGKE